MAYNTTPNADVRADGTVRNSNYRTLWGVVYAVIALAIVAGAAMLFMRDRTAAPYTPGTTVESTNTNGMGTTAPDTTTAPATSAPTTLAPETTTPDTTTAPAD